MAFRNKNKTDKTADSKTSTPKTDTHSTDPTFDETIASLSNSVAWFFSRPAALYKWLTAPAGGQRIILGTLALYFWAVSAEAYWQALGVGEQFAKTGKLDGETFTAVHTSHPSFVPKPFSPNTGSLNNMGTAIGDPGFFITGVISLAILGVQANLQRGKKTVAQAKTDYEAVKNLRVGDVPKDAIDLAKIEAEHYKTAGTHQQRSVSAVVKASYAIDIVANAAAYGSFLFGGIGGFISSAAWIYSGVFGAENFLNLWQANEDAVKAAEAAAKKNTPFTKPKAESKTEETPKAA